MPGDPAFCREKARRCAEIAGQQEDSELKQTFEELALSWKRMAERLEIAQALVDRRKEASREERGDPL